MLCKTGLISSYPVLCAEEPYTLPYMIMTLLPTIAGAWSHPCGVFCHISDPIQGVFLHRGALLSATGELNTLFPVDSFLLFSCEAVDGKSLLGYANSLMMSSST